MTGIIFDNDRLDVYRLALKFNGVAESQAEYNAIDDYEHRYAEHEHDRSDGKRPPRLMPSDPDPDHKQ